MASTPVQKELGKIAADFRRFRILRGLAICWGLLALLGGAVLILYSQAGVVLPYAVPALLGIAVIAAIIIFLRGNKTSVALREIARQVEKDNPSLNSLLLAAAEQEPDSKTGELNYLQLRVVREALEANRKTPWGQRFYERLFWAQSLQLGTLCLFVIVLMGMGVMVSQKNPVSLLAGGGLEITPGNISVEKGSALAIVAKFGGRAPGEVQLVYKTQSGEETRIPMARSLNDPLFGFTLPEVQERTTYHVEYDGKASADFTADVFEYPQLKRADADLKYPAYTLRSAEKIEDTRRVSAVEGTDVHYTFYLNKPVRVARLIGTNDTTLLLSNSAPNEVSYATDFRLLDSGSYKLELVDEDGRTNKVPPQFVFVALPNLPPKLKLTNPRGDQRVSSLQEVRFEATAEDDFGLVDYGLAYTMAGSKTELLSLSSATNQAASGMISKPHESQAFSWLLAFEKLAAEPGQLVSYYLWADDLGPDGTARRSESDIFFAEVRPFEEIFRQGNSDQSSQQQQQQQQGQGSSPAGQLLELQKEIITATWNLRRRENRAKPGPAFKEDAEVVHESQETAIQQANDMAGEMRDDKMVALVTTAVSAMKSASEQLAEAARENEVAPLPKALEFEQSAYQALLKLQAREYQVTRSQSQSASSSSSQQQRAQQQLDQLELKEEENRYETESEASPLMNEEQREALQVLNRLKELARRQQDMSERIKELQSALNEAKTQEEKEKLERMLKRLQEEQQQIVQDTDELRQRMSQPENQSRMAEAREQLDRSREQSREAAEQLENRELSQALSSSSRAQQQLEQLSDEFRKQTSSQFAEEMRQMRQQARELEEQHTEIAEKIDSADEPARRSLAEKTPAQQAMEQVEQERAALTNLLANIRGVTERSEQAEPLLSKQLYETLRRTSQANPEATLETLQEVLRRGYLPEARQVHERAEETIRELKEGVERAAENVLGNEAESLRFAENELRRLTERVEEELARARGSGSTNANGTNAVAGSGRYGTNMLASATPGGTNTLSSMLSGNGTNELGSQLAQLGSRNQDNPGEQGRQGSQQGARQGNNNQQGQQDQGSTNQQGDQSPQGQQSREGQPGNQQGQRQGQQGQQGQEGQQGQQGSPNQGQQGQQNQEGQPGQQQGQQRGNQPGQQGQEGQQGQQGQEGQQGQRALAQNGQPRSGNNQGRGEPREGDPNQPGGGRAERFQVGGIASGGGFEGPMTGRDFTRWSDRLRDVEEILQDPDLRLDVARVREEARTWRAEQRQRGGEPQWDLLEDQVINPLRMVQRRVADELARHQSREAVVPVDRDPVPQKYSDLVSRYYERLGSE